MENPKPSPCECIERLRKFKNETLYDFVEAVTIPEPGPLGIFGVEVPEQEEIEEAIKSVKTGLEEYTKHCPWAPTPEAIELDKKLKEVTGKTATLKKVVSGEYEWTYQDFIAACEKFIYSAIEGLMDKTEGYKSPKGPFSADLITRQTCFSRLNNIEAAKKELLRKAENAEGSMTAPEELVKDMDELNDTQRGIYKDYCRECRAYSEKLEKDLEHWPRDKEHVKETLENFDKWTEEHKEELLKKREHIEDRLDSREHWVWEWEKAIADHQTAIDVFLETEWSNVCGNLRWKK